MEPTRSILLATEDGVIRTFLADNLTADGFEVIAVGDKAEALQRLARERPDLVLCDVNGTTLELVDAVRHDDGLASAIDADVPLIVLTARTDELARVRYFEHGGDDVVAKPFSYPELLARIRAVLRRSYERSPSRVIRVGTLRIDLGARAVQLAGVQLDITGKQYALLVHLAASPTRVFRKDELLRTVWGYRSSGSTRTLESHAFRLRNQLRAVDDVQWLENIWGVGYRLLPVDPRAANPQIVA